MLWISQVQGAPQVRCLLTSVCYKNGLREIFVGIINFFYRFFSDLIQNFSFCNRIEFELLWQLPVLQRMVMMTKGIKRFRPEHLVMSRSLLSSLKLLCCCCTVLDMGLPTCLCFHHAAVQRQRRALPGSLRALPVLQIAQQGSPQHLPPCSIS